MVKTMVESIHFLPLSEQVRLVHNGSVSAVENVKAHLNVINSLNPRLNSFITIDSEGEYLYAVSWSRFGNIKLEKYNLDNDVWINQ